MRQGVSKASRAEEKARRKDLEKTFGKKVAKNLVPIKIVYEDLRTEEQKHLIDRLRQQVAEDEEALRREWAGESKPKSSQ
jgi:hypothetical protein